MLYDLDGTLVDSAQDIVASVRAALRLIDQREPPDSDDIIALIGRPLGAVLRDLGYPSDPGSNARFAACYRDDYARHFTDHSRPFAGVPMVQLQLRAAGVKQAVVTTKHQAQAELVIAGFGLAGLFDHLRGHLDGQQQKPHPEPMLAAMDSLGVKAEETLVVGDTELDIETGRAAGATTCAVTYGYRPVELLHMARPDFMLSDLRDLVPIVTGA